MDGKEPFYRACGELWCNMRTLFTGEDRNGEENREEIRCEYISPHELYQSAVRCGELAVKSNVQAHYRNVDSTSWDHSTL